MPAAGRPGSSPRTRTPAGQEIPGAKAAGTALAGCKKLAVLIAAEYGRTAAWQQIGYLAGRVAAARGGGVAPQTTGANALAAVRLADKLQTISLAEALASDGQRVAVGCDVIGMLGGIDVEILAAAAALPSPTTDRCGLLLPTAMPGELGGTYLLGGARQVKVEPMLAAPAGIETPGALVGALATAAGVARPRIPSHLPLGRLSREVPYHGCGALTGHGSWQAAVQPEPALRICPQYAAELNLKNLSVATVRANGRSVRARVRFSPELPPGTIVLPEGLAACRALLPAQIDPQKNRIVYEPTAVEVSC